jgi:hypothetical protein
MRCYPRNLISPDQRVLIGLVIVFYYVVLSQIGVNCGEIRYDAFHVPDILRDQHFHNPRNFALTP